MSVALEAVITRFARLLHHVALRHGVRAEDVDDVIQEVRVRLWRARPTSETIATLGVSYVYRTAMSAALEVVNRRRGSGPPQVALDHREEGEESRSLKEPASIGGEPDALLERSEFGRVVSDAVAELADARRTVVRLYLVGYSREEIAAMVGWSEAKTRNLIYRGLADLRRALERRGIGPGSV